MPLSYLPVVWLGVAGTAFTRATLAHARVDVPRLLASLHICSESTFTLCLYGVWTLAAACLLWFLLLQGGSTPMATGLEGSPRLVDFALAFVGAALAIGLWPLIQRAALFFGRGRPIDWLLDRQQAGGDGLWDSVLLTLVAAILVPVFEEFIFRGYVVTALYPHLSVPAVILLSSVIFASVHVARGLTGVVYAFALALMLSGLFLFSSSLYPPIFMHSLVNFFGFVVAPALWRVQSLHPAKRQKPDA